MQQQHRCRSVVITPFQPPDPSPLDLQMGDQTNLSTYEQQIRIKKCRHLLVLLPFLLAAVLRHGHGHGDGQRGGRQGHKQLGAFLELRFLDFWFWLRKVRILFFLLFFARFVLIFWSEEVWPTHKGKSSRCGPCQDMHSQRFLTNIFSINQCFPASFNFSATKKLLFSWITECYQICR